MKLHPLLDLIAHALVDDGFDFTVESANLIHVTRADGFDVTVKGTNSSSSTNGLVAASNISAMHTQQRIDDLVIGFFAGRNSRR